MALPIEVEVKTVYGNELIYPVSEGAKILASIAGKKTLSTADLANARKLGLGICITRTVPAGIAALAT